MTKQAIVFRYGHRIIRDERVTSHCCLVARALGADKIIIHGNKDTELEKTIQEINSKWGGRFTVEFAPDWKKGLKNLKKQKYSLVHLTMYGIPINKIQQKIRKENKTAIIIGSQKVEKEVFELADYNVSIGAQPHSEIAAIAVMLDRIFQGKEFEKKFANAKLKIKPSKKSKIIEKTR